MSANDQGANAAASPSVHGARNSAANPPSKHSSAVKRMPALRARGPSSRATVKLGGICCLLNRDRLRWKHRSPAALSILCRPARFNRKTGRPLFLTALQPLGFRRFSPGRPARPHDGTAAATPEKAPVRAALSSRPAGSRPRKRAVKNASESNAFAPIATPPTNPKDLPSVPPRIFIEKFPFGDEPIVRWPRPICKAGGQRKKSAKPAEDDDKVQDRHPRDFLSFQ